MSEPYVIGTPLGQSRTPLAKADSNVPVTTLAPEKQIAHEEHNPTDSHVLAHADPEVLGAAQLNHGHTEVRDLGWNEDAKDVPTPLVGGLPNEELWTLIRRFNKVRSDGCQKARIDWV